MTSTPQPRRWSYALAILTLWGALLGPLCGESFAQDEPVEDPAATADKHYQQAMLLFNQGRYNEAVKHFNDAIELAPDPIYYCNRAVAHVKLDELNRAIESMTICRDTIGDPNEAALIDAQLNALRVFQEQLRPSARQVATSINTSNSPPIKPPVIIKKDEGWGLSDFGIISLAIGGALAASAITLDVLSAEDVETLKKEHQSGDKRRYDEAKASIEQRQPLWIGLSAAGATFALLGVSLIIIDLSTDDDAPEQAAPITLSPAVSPDGFGAQLHWRF